RELHLLRDLLRSGLAANLLNQVAAGAGQLVDRLDHVHRDADGARLIGDGPGDGLTDPPRGVGAELVAALVLELVHRLHQADVPLLDQVEELQPAVGVLLRDRHHEAEVGLHQLGLGPLRLALADPDRLVVPAQQLHREVGLLLDPLDLPHRGADVAVDRLHLLLGDVEPLLQLLGGAGFSRGCGSMVRSPFTSIPSERSICRSSSSAFSTRSMSPRRFSTMRSICFLLSRISSSTSIILVRASRISCLTSLRLASESFFLPLSSSSSASTTSACFRIRSICLQICSMRLSSLWFSWAALSPSAASPSASPSASPWFSSGASFTTSRIRSFPLRRRVPMSRMSATASRQASSARRTSFSLSSMRLAISTSPSRVRRETEPIFRR